MRNKIIIIIIDIIIIVFYTLTVMIKKADMINTF